jgi:hypothetical protein
MVMRTAYRVLAYLLALSVAVQASLIAFGALSRGWDSGLAVPALLRRVIGAAALGPMRLGCTAAAACG